MPHSKALQKTALDHLHIRSETSCTTGGNHRRHFDIGSSGWQARLARQVCIRIHSCSRSYLQLPHVNAPVAYLGWRGDGRRSARSEEHTSELQSLMRISYAVFCLKKKKHNNNISNASP